MRLLLIGNKQLPDTDYRVRLAAHLPEHEVLLGLPGRPPTVPEDRYVSFGFREGVEAEDAAHWVRLGRYLRRERRRLDVAHFFSTQLVLFGPLVARAARVRPWVTVTGYGRVFNEDTRRSRALRPIYKSMMAASFRAAERVFFQNRGDMATAAGWFPWAADRLEWIGSAVDLPVTAPKPCLDRPLRVLLVSRIMPSKGIETFLDVARTSASLAVPPRFTLVGPPSPGAEGTQRAVEEAHQAGIIEYRGELLGQELDQVYLDHDVMLFPSHGEGMARVMLETGFHGMLPIASDIPANRDLVLDGTGFLFPVGDAAAAAAALQRVHEDRDALLDRAKAYQAHIVEEYSMEGYADRVQRALEGASL